MTNGKLNDIIAEHFERSEHAPCKLNNEKPSDCKRSQSKLHQNNNNWFFRK